MSRKTRQGFRKSHVGEAFTHRSLSEDNLKVAAAATAAAATREAIADLDSVDQGFGQAIYKRSKKTKSTRFTQKTLYDLASRKMSYNAEHSGAGHEPFLDEHGRHLPGHFENLCKYYSALGATYTKGGKHRLYQKKALASLQKNFNRFSTPHEVRINSATRASVIHNELAGSATHPISALGANPLTTDSVTAAQTVTPFMATAEATASHAATAAGSNATSAVSAAPAVTAAAAHERKLAGALNGVASGEHTSLRETTDDAAKFSNTEAFINARGVGAEHGSVTKNNADISKMARAVDANDALRTHECEDELNEQFDSLGKYNDERVMSASFGAATAMTGLQIDSNTATADAVNAAAEAYAASAAIANEIANTTSTSLLSTFKVPHGFEAFTSNHTEGSAPLNPDPEDAMEHAHANNPIGLSDHVRNAVLGNSTADASAAGAVGATGNAGSGKGQTSGQSHGKKREKHGRRDKSPRATAPLVRFLGHWLYHRGEGIMLDKSAATILGHDNYHEWFPTKDFHSNFLPHQSERLLFSFSSALMGDIIFERLTFIKGPCAGHTFVVQGSVLEREPDGTATFASGYLSHESSPYSEFLTRELSGDGLFFWNAATDEVISSASYHEMLGYTEAEFPHSFTAFVENLVHPDDNDILLVQEHIVRTPFYGNYFESCLRLKHKNGHYIWTIARGLVIERNEQGVATQVLGSQTDINIVQDNFENIKFMMFTDSLTGLHNRTYFQQNALRFSAPEQCPVSIIFIDVSGLKVTNDILGHSYGDYLLIKTSEIIRDAINNYRTHAKHEKEYIEVGKRHYKDPPEHEHRTEFYKNTLPSNSNMPLVDDKLKAKLKQSEQASQDRDEGIFNTHEFIAAGASSAFRNLSKSELCEHIHNGNVAFVDNSSYFEGTASHDGSIESIDANLYPNKISIQERTITLGNAVRSAAEAEAKVKDKSCAKARVQEKTTISASFQDDIAAHIHDSDDKNADQNQAFNHDGKHQHQEHIHSLDQGYGNAINNALTSEAGINNLTVAAAALTKELAEETGTAGAASAAYAGALGATGIHSARSAAATAASSAAIATAATAAIDAAPATSADAASAAMTAESAQTRAIETAENGAAPYETVSPFTGKPSYPNSAQIATTAFAAGVKAQGVIIPDEDAVDKELRAGSLTRLAREDAQAHDTRPHLVASAIVSEDVNEAARVVRAGPAAQSTQMSNAVIAAKEAAADAAYALTRAASHINNKMAQGFESLQEGESFTNDLYVHKTTRSSASRNVSEYIDESELASQNLPLRTAYVDDPISTPTSAIAGAVSEDAGFVSVYGVEHTGTAALRDAADAAGRIGAGQTNFQANQSSSASASTAPQAGAVGTGDANEATIAMAGSADLASAGAAINPQSAVNAGHAAGAIHGKGQKGSDNFDFISDRYINTIPSTVATIRVRGGNKKVLCEEKERDSLIMEPSFHSNTTKSLALSGDPSLQDLGGSILNEVNDLGLGHHSPELNNARKTVINGGTLLTSREHRNENYNLESADKSSILAHVYHDSMRTTGSHNVMDAFSKLGSPLNPHSVLSHGVKAVVVRNASADESYAPLPKSSSTFINSQNPSLRQNLTLDDDFDFDMVHYASPLSGGDNNIRLVDAADHQSTVRDKASGTANSAAASTLHHDASAASHAHLDSSYIGLGASGDEVIKNLNFDLNGSPNTGYGNNLACDANIMKTPELSHIFELDHTYSLRTRRCDLSIHDGHLDPRFNECDSVQESIAAESGLYDSIIRNEEKVESVYELAYTESFSNDGPVFNPYDDGTITLESESSDTLGITSTNDTAHTDASQKAETDAQVNAEADALASTSAAPSKTDADHAHATNTAQALASNATHETNADSEPSEDDHIAAAITPSHLEESRATALSADDFIEHSAHRNDSSDESSATASANAVLASATLESPAANEAAGSVSAASQAANAEAAAKKADTAVKDAQREDKTCGGVKKSNDGEELKHIDPTDPKRVNSFSAATANAAESTVAQGFGPGSKLSKKIGTKNFSGDEESGAKTELLRLAGDEFLVILPHCDESEAAAICKAIDYTRNMHNAFHEQNTPINERPVPIFFGIGHATYNPEKGETKSLKETVDLADSRMQQNKNARRSFDYKYLKMYFENKKGREVSMRDERRFVVLDDNDRNEIRRHRLSNIIF